MVATDPAHASELTDRIRFTAGGRLLAEYVHRPADPQLESPRPYFHPLRTLGGELLTDVRPDDHVWHKGLSWTLPVVGDENFWGGPSYLAGSGYRQLPNNGTQRHRAFTELVGTGFVERLDWVAEGGALLLDELRRVTAAVLDESTWVLGFTTTLRNTSDAPLVFGSPTTRGRPNAGYGGLFWRGPRSFVGGTVLSAAGAGGDELRGADAVWLGYTGRHDSGARSTVVIVDRLAAAGAPRRPWFVRSEEYACLCPAPFFHHEHVLDPGESFDASYDIVIADGASDAAGLVAQAAALSGGRSG